MLRMKHREEASSAGAEERIREDERRRVMAEMRGDDRAGTMADDRADPRRDDRAGPVDDGRARPMTADTTDDDWRSTPPAVDEPRFDDPRDRRRDDPRGWDVPDERAAREDRVAAHEDRMVARDDRAVERAPVRQDAVLEQRPWAVEDETVTERGFSPGQILIVLAGVASLALGIVAIARTGLDGSLSEPVKPVLGWDHTALLGLFEIGAGVLMILGGLRAGARWFGGLVGLAVIVGGVLILGRLDWTVTRLGAERDFGWVAIVIGAVAVIGAAIPRIRRSHRRTSTTSSTSAPTATY
jgi:hypothetical protein